MPKPDDESQLLAEKLRITTITAAAAADAEDAADAPVYT